MQPDVIIPNAANTDSAGRLLRWFTHFRITGLPTLVSVFFAMAAALLIRGYQFGESNHNVYLLDGLRQATGLLANDWFTTQTLQYHAAFSKLVKILYELNIIQPAFLWLYLATLFFFHLGWCQIVLKLGGTRTTFMLSVALYYLSAGGLGLGVYEFMQDRSFLPSNVANVAMLWGIYFWMTRRFGWSGACLALAGIAHLNHAIVAILLWGCLVVGLLLDDVPAHRQWRKTLLSKPLIIGSLVLFICCTVNILLALVAMWPKRDGLPFDQFINLYVKLRHPHHYDPSSWPMALWASFLWPIPLAVIAYRRRNRAPKEFQFAWTSAGRVFIVISILTLVAMLFAGVTYVNDTLVKLSLFRFSIYLKLLSCVGAAWMIYPPATKLRARWYAWAAVAMIAVFCIAARAETLLAASSHWLPPRVELKHIIFKIGVLAILSFFWIVQRATDVPARGLLKDLWNLCFAFLVAWFMVLGILASLQPGTEEQMPADLAAWVNENTPPDALFLIPPHNEDFRLHARRAVVVNFKGVAQLNAELVQWRDRMQDVLKVDDLMTLRGDNFFGTLANIRRRYDELSPEYLADVARRYGASYMILEKEWPAGADKIAFASGRILRYYVYRID